MSKVSGQLSIVSEAIEDVNRVVSCVDRWKIYFINTSHNVGLVLQLHYIQFVLAMKSTGSSRYLSSNVRERHVSA